jgi:tripartite-type tricarboxylate transporter receptor subunit TctC
MRMTNLRTTTFVFGLLTVLTASVGFSRAQTSLQSWPQRPVKFIVPFVPGAGADIGARLLSERLQSRGTSLA